MFNKILDSENFIISMILSIIKCVSFIFVGAYYYLSNVGHNSFQSNALTDFMVLFANWVMNASLVVWFVASTYPLLNYAADKVQFSNIISHAHELGMFYGRPRTT